MARHSRQRNWDDISGANDGFESPDALRKTTYGVGFNSRARFGSSQGKSGAKVDAIGAGRDFR